MNNVFSGLIINEKAAYLSLIKSPAVTTALSPYIGYHKAAELAKFMKEGNIDIFEANNTLKLIEDSKLKTILTPGNLLKLGFSLDDI